MTVDGYGGSVTRVEVLDAKPRRVFDRAVVKTLSQWRFTPGAAGRSWRSTSTSTARKR